MGIFTDQVTYTESPDEPGSFDVDLEERNIGTLYENSSGYLFEYRTAGLSKHFHTIKEAKEWVEEYAGDIEDGLAVG